ncbi:hypothetical protein C8J56DRAFT_879833 [Mycena floridula]|nr:hypothetical protein C8J56DRAFT_879833 [Mycena floridula]
MACKLDGCKDGTSGLETVEEKFTADVEKIRATYFGREKAGGREMGKMMVVGQFHGVGRVSSVGGPGFVLQVRFQISTMKIGIFDSFCHYLQMFWPSGTIKADLAKAEMLTYYFGGKISSFTQSFLLYTLNSIATPQTSPQLIIQPTLPFANTLVAPPYIFQSPPPSPLGYPGQSGYPGEHSTQSGEVIQLSKSIRPGIRVRRTSPVYQPQYSYAATNPMADPACRTVQSQAY